MRYITITNLKKGMLLARNLYDENCNTAFPSEIKLSGSQVDKIKKMGYPGAYILDACSDEIVPEPYVSEELHLKTVQVTSTLLAGAAGPQRDTHTMSVERQHELIQPVLDEMRARDKMFIDTIDLKPFAGYNSYHATTVMILSLAIGLQLGLNGEQLFELGIASLLHDVGTAFLPLGILNRPGKLTDEEYEQMKQHVEMGADYLKNNYNLHKNATAGVLQHHENYNGTGYPNGLKRKNISLYGRIIAVTDVYDALVSKRAYRPAMYPMQALDVVQQQSDRKFDPDVVDALARVVAPCPSGVIVKLKTGEVCIVAKNYYKALSRPKLQLFDGKRAGNPYINLYRDPEYAKVRITKIQD